MAKKSCAEYAPGTCPCCSNVEKFKPKPYVVVPYYPSNAEISREEYEDQKNAINLAMEKLFKATLYGYDMRSSRSLLLTEACEILKAVTK